MVWDPYFAQDPYEPAWEYLDRFMDQMEIYYSHYSMHEYILMFLDNITSREHSALDYMAGGSVMNCTPNEVWCLIEERVEFSRYFSEYNSEQPHKEEMEQLKRDPTWLSPEPTASYLDDSEVTVAMDEQENEFMLEEALHIMSATCIEDIPSDVLTPSDCSEIIKEDITVRTCNSNLSYESNMVLSCHVQDYRIHESLGIDKGFTFFVPKLGSDPTFVWKPGWNLWRSISDKGVNKVRNSVRKFDGAHPWDPNII